MRRTKDELAKMRKAGRVVAEMHAKTREAIKPGVTTMELDRVAREVLEKRGARSNFLNYHGFPAVICTSPNDMIVHGIPSEKVVLKDGDIISIDCGAIIEGYHGDAAYTAGVGDISPEARKLIEVTEASLAAGIEQMRDGNRLTDISHAVQLVAEAGGYGVVREYVGHAIGTAMHEEPQVPNYGPPGKGPKLRSGMVFAIEPMVNMGRPETFLLEDGWSVVTADGSLSVHVEHTIAITDNGPEIYTLPASAPRREVGCALAFEFLEPSVLALQIAPPTVLTEELTVVGAGPPRVLVGANGGRTHIIEGGVGAVTVNYTASTAPVVVARAVGVFDEGVLVARRQSRYCPSDQMAEFATRELEGFLDADDLAERVASWVFERTAYDAFVSGPSDTAVDTLLAGRGVCRDFAHLTMAMCRALFVPARLASVYAPGVEPMDFHAVVEVWRNDRWDVIDATRMAPRSSLVRIATGRDAADTAFAATLTGDVELVNAEVFAVVDGSLPLDDHVNPTQLA